jgi:hypothetical protein
MIPKLILKYFEWIKVAQIPGSSGRFLKKEMKMSKFFDGGFYIKDAHYF